MRNDWRPYVRSRLRSLNVKAERENEIDDFVHGGAAHTRDGQVHVIGHHAVRRDFNVHDRGDTPQLRGSVVRHFGVPKARSRFRVAVVTKTCTSPR